MCNVHLRLRWVTKSKKRYKSHVYDLHNLSLSIYILYCDGGGGPKKEQENNVHQQRSENVKKKETKILGSTLQGRMVVATNIMRIKTERNNYVHRPETSSLIKP